ncbi:MAG: PIN domain-containing protein [Planctomycetia bacterium]|nr:PIN domain-containing protein [Planctomycetia bacterium]
MSLALADIPPGDSVFVDANIFIYGLSAHPVYATACIEFLERIERQDVMGVTSSAVLAEVSHRLMTIEACEVYGWPVAGIAQRLRKSATEIKTLRKFADAVRMIPKLNIQIAPTGEQLVIRATELSQSHGLLTNDALIAATMNSLGIRCIATRDDDFDRLQTVLRFSP